MALAVILLPLCAFAPGYFVIRRFRWNPLAKLCGAVALSLILLFLAGWIVYVANLPWRACSIAISVASAILFAVSHSDVRRLFAISRVRQSSAALAFLLLWTLVILASIRHYSGAGWGGDWLEHFNRTLVYLNRLPASTEVFGDYRIPSRPPMAHIVTAFIMAQTQDAFEIYQLVFVFLNLIVFLPCCLLVARLARTWKFAIVPLTAIFALSPVIMVNSTYTGVKSLAAFFVITAIAFYLSAWKRGDPGLMSAAFISAAGGAIAHYSAIPYGAFLGIHYLVAILPHRKGGLKELATFTGLAAVPLIAWFGWCIATFGFQGSFMAAVNTSVGYKYSAQENYALKAAANLFDAIVPHLARDWSLVQIWNQPNTLGYVRDNAFLIYQTSVIFSLGSAGGFLVWWFVVRRLSQQHSPERNFWLGLLCFAIAAGFILAGERDYYGQAHIVLVSMMAMGLTMLAAIFTRHRRLAFVIIAGCALDFSLGIYVHMRVEHLENTAKSTPFTSVQFGPQVVDLMPPNAQTLSRFAGNNWFNKHQYALAQSLMPALSGRTDLSPAEQAVRDYFAAVVYRDEGMFGGWFHRHHGEITFFGDHFDGSDIPSVLLIIGALAILWKLSRSVPPLATAAAVSSPKRARRRKR